MITPTHDGGLGPGWLRTASRSDGAPDVLRPRARYFDQDPPIGGGALFKTLTGERGRSAVALATEELREDLLPDWAAGTLGSDDPDLVAAAMVGTGLMVARQLRGRGHLDPEEAARFCTRFTLGGLVPATKSSTLSSTSRDRAKRRTA